MKRFFTLLTSLVMLISCACAEGAATTFTASAGVSYTAEADGAVITLTIAANDETLAEAEAKASASADALKYAFLGAGALAEDISVVRSDVQLDQKYQYNKLKEPELVIIGRSVEYVMTVRVTDISKLKAQLDAAVGSGLYSSYEVRRTSSAIEDAYQAALSEAAKSALARAEALAKACGFTRTEVVSVTELPSESIDGLTGIAQAEVTLAAQK